MTAPIQDTEPLSLWDCLHDGKAISFESDSMARTLTLSVNAAYHWKFHQLPADTRFRITGENVRIAEVFDFEPWLGAIEPPRETPWEEAQAQRMSDYQKGLLVSMDWNAFVVGVKTDDYKIMNAELIRDTPLAILELGLMEYPNGKYPTVRIHAERFRFHIGAREVSAEDFQQFGEVYWKHFAQRSNSQS